jgi:hypothetical protein
MTDLTSYERLSTFKTSVTWTSGSTAVDPSGNMSFIDIFKADGTYLLQAASGERDGVGIFHYYASTASTDPLGIYRIRWYAYFNYAGNFGYMPLSQQEAIVIEKIVQS